MMLCDSHGSVFEPKHIDTSPLNIAKHMWCIVDKNTDMSISEVCSNLYHTFPSIGMNEILFLQMSLDPVALGREGLMEKIRQIVAEYEKQHENLLNLVRKTYPQERYTSSPKDIDLSVLKSIHDYASYQDFHVKALQGRFAFPSEVEPYVRGEEDAYWWTLDQTRFLQVIMMNALGLVTQGCEEGGMNIHSRVSLIADCLKPVFQFLKEKLEAEKFIVARLTSNKDGMTQVEGKLFKTQSGEYAWVHPRYVHITKTIFPTEFLTQYRNFDDEVESFVIMDPIMGRLADSLDGLFTRTLYHLQDYKQSRSMTTEKNGISFRRSTMLNNMNSPATSILKSPKKSIINSPKKSILNSPNITMIYHTPTKGTKSTTIKWRQ